jgi:hypothetical protein
MSPESWLPIADYAGKYRVSISTLRRRIKAGDIEYSFQDGKYLLKDAPLIAKPQPMPAFQQAATATVAPPQRYNGGGPASQVIAQMSEGEDNSPILATANRLLNELKKAYSLILQEKEEQMLQLKEEVADLRTLVRVLEAENERLKGSGLDLNWSE